MLDTNGLGQISGLAYCALELSILIMRISLENKINLSMAACGVVFILSALMLPWTMLEHGRLIRLSFLLNTYLFLSILLDIT